MVTLFRRMDSYDADMCETLKRIGEAERITRRRGVFFHWLDRGGVAVPGAAVALVFRQWG